MILYREMLYRRALETPGGAVSAAPVVRAVADFAGSGDAGLGTAAGGFQHCGGAERHGGSARKRDERDGAGNALSRSAYGDAAGGGCGAVRYAGSDFYHRGFRGWQKLRPANVSTKTQLLDVQAKEGLTLGLAITVRYRLDAKRLDYIQGNLPRPVEKEIVPPTVASVWREIVPNYTVRDVFSAKREEVRQRAAGLITQKLAADGIVVKEVMLRDIQLPPEYAKGLEALLLKEQENDRMGVETELKSKQVRIAELEAEATKVQQVKQAEGEAQVHVLQAKGEADAMQYTLPLKEKQIEQSRLEAQARKEATIQNAEAEAQAKVIDSKAEGERRKLLAEAEADRIRVTAVADAERMHGEAAILKDNPLLINKIVAETVVGQAADHDGAGGWEVLFCQ